ncbi:MAG: cytidylate kinase-like family protein [bacterium]|nr:cytidylate kinase-like family protein [bacterium]
MSREIHELDRKIAAWLEQQRAKALKEAETENRIMSSRSITISREYGCEGYPLAVALKELLEDASGDQWTIFDRSLIEKLETEYDMTKEFLDHLGDKASAVDRLKAMLSRNWSEEQEGNFRKIADTIFSIASAGHAIIVGRGGSVICEDLPHCFHFRLHAPEWHRVNSYMLRTGCSKDEASAAVLEAQESSSLFFREFLNADLSDHQHYHACFNTSKTKITSIARAITHLVGF